MPLLGVEAQVVDAVALGGQRKVARRFPELAGILQGANSASHCSPCPTQGPSGSSMHRNSCMNSRHHLLTL